MSNLFPGNQPKPSDERKDAPRTPLFPRKEDAPTGTSFAAKASKEGENAPQTPQAPQTPRAPLFPPRTGTPPVGQTTQAAQAPQTPRAPLFPPRAGTAPAGQTIQAPQTTQTPQAPQVPRAPLFPPRAETTPGQAAQAPQAPRAPLFPSRDPNAAPQAPLFPKREDPKPLFPSRPAESAKPLFSSNPAAPAKPMFNTTPPAPDKSAFSTGGSARDVKVSDAEFIQLRDFLYEQAGIFIAENRKYLVENRLASRLRELGLRNFGEYYNYLRFDNNKGKELNVFFENMTTNETSFFRNGPQLDVFRDKVLLKVIEECRAKKQKKLRIWSAGCSSGEEPYTLAMIIYEVLKQETPTWDIKITANDLSLAMLAAARRGLYNDYAIRTTPQDMLDRYFTKESSGLYQIDRKLQRLISFGQINLNDKAQLARVERSQIVFCRNVIIYFDDEMKRNVITAFYDNLLPGGSLLIGHSESLHNISRAFKPEHYSGTIVYRKQV